MADKAHIVVWKCALAVVAALILAFASAVLAGIVSHSLGLPFEPQNAFRFFSGFAAGILAAKFMKGRPE